MCPTTGVRPAETRHPTMSKGTNLKIRHFAAVALCALALTACAEDPKPTTPPVMPPGTTAAPATTAAATSSSTPGVYAPMDTGVSKASGMEASILSVEDANSRYGPVTVFTIQLFNAGQKVFDGSGFPTPTLVYGPAGTKAENTVSMTEGYGEGVAGAIPPGMRQTVKYAYQVQKSQLNPTVFTAGSVIWQGDFTSFLR